MSDCGHSMRFLRPAQRPRHCLSPVAPKLRCSGIIARWVERLEGCLEAVVAHEAWDRGVAGHEDGQHHEDACLRHRGAGSVRSRIAPAAGPYNLQKPPHTLEEPSIPSTLGATVSALCASARGGAGARAEDGGSTEGDERRVKQLHDREQGNERERQERERVEEVPGNTRQ